MMKAHQDLADQSIKIWWLEVKARQNENWKWGIHVLRGLYLILDQLYQEMSWILQDKLGCLLEREPFFPLNLFIWIQPLHIGNLACVMQEARLGGHHSPFHQGDLSGSERVLGQIIWETDPRITSQGVCGQVVEQAFTSHSHCSAVSRRL